MGAAARTGAASSTLALVLASCWAAARVGPACCSGGVSSLTSLRIVGCCKEGPGPSAACVSAPDVVGRDGGCCIGAAGSLELLFSFSGLWYAGGLLVKGGAAPLL